MLNPIGTFHKHATNLTAANVNIFQGSCDSAFMNAMESIFNYYSNELNTILANNNNSFYNSFKIGNGATNKPFEAIYTLVKNDIYNLIKYFYSGANSANSANY